MKVLNKTAISGLRFLGRKVSLHPTLYSVIDALKVGEGVSFSKSEWKAKSPPSSVIGSRYNSTGIQFSVRQLADRSGYVVIRKA